MEDVADAPAASRRRRREPARLPGGALAALGQYAGFLPALVLFGVFFLAPLGLIVAYSFWQTVDYNVVHHWTLDNYRYFFSVSTYVTTLWATIWVSVAATAITLADRVPVRVLARALRAARGCRGCCSSS